MLLALLLLSALPFVSAEQGAPAATSDVAEARAARDQAVDWLLANQREDGGWATSVIEATVEEGFAVESYYAWQVAAGALACMALLEVEETPTRRAGLERGLGWLCDARRPRRGSDWDVDHVWGGLYGFVACVRAARDARFTEGEWPARLRAAGTRFFTILERNQSPKGGWAYYDDPVYTRRPKWDTSFCTALVLPALVTAMDLGWVTDGTILARARRYVAACALPNGAYAYDHDLLPRYGSMLGGESIDSIKGSLSRIQVCNWGLAKTGEGKITPDRLREGLENFFRHHRFLDAAWKKPYPHEAFYANSGYFYVFGHYYAAEVIALLPAAEREAWHARLRPHLLKRQRPDGSVSDFLLGGYTTVSCTAFLVLALELGLSPSP